MNHPRTVLITGANGGIGQALCALFRQNGWFVVATDIQRTHQASCDRYLSADLLQVSSDSSYREDRLRELRACLPDSGRLDALINNAAKQVVAPVEKLTASDWHDTFGVNVTAPFLLVQGLLKELEHGGGTVINIGSVHAELTKPQFVAYATSKAALVALTRALAVELGGRVRVNAVCPAAVSTPMLLAGFEGNEEGLSKLAGCHPSRCIGTPEEIAGMVFALASSLSHYVNGAVLNVDGGIGSRLCDPA